MSYVLRWADVVALLVKKPRTKGELREMTGISKNSLDGVLFALRDEGLLMQLKDKRQGRSGKGSSPDLWTWAP